jgi:hypothetical protein
MSQSHHEAKHQAIADFYRRRFIAAPVEDEMSHRLEVVLHRLCATRTPAEAEAIIRFARIAQNNPALIQVLKRMSVVGARLVDPASSLAGGVSP